MNTSEYKRLLAYIKNKENVVQTLWDGEDQDVYKGSWWTKPFKGIKSYDCALLK